MISLLCNFEAIIFFDWSRMTLCITFDNLKFNFNWCKNVVRSENSCFTDKIKKSLCLFSAQGISLSPFGGSFSYPYRYVAAPAALPTCSVTSTLSRNNCFRSPRPWLRYNPYLIPNSVTTSHNLLTARSLGSSNSELSKSGSRESSPVSDNHSHQTKAKQTIAPPKNTVKSSSHELQNIHDLVRGLDEPFSPQ